MTNPADNAVRQVLRECGYQWPPINAPHRQALLDGLSAVHGTSAVVNSAA